MCKVPCQLMNFIHILKNICNIEHAENVADQEEFRDDIFSELNVQINENEISDVLKNLKNGKATGIDYLLNEYFHKFRNDFVPLLCVLFNCIFDSGCFPSEWSKGILIPLHKKGNPNVTNNYRGITIISNLAKIFTSVLNNRLLKWSTVNNVITDSQFGFRPGFSTSDAIFALHSLISIFLNAKKKLFCCFVDYKKAFDSVNRFKLFFKLARSGITGKFLKIVKSLYSDVKACVRYKNSMSDFFSCTNGLMQGEALSPFLFSLYINDFEMDLISNLCEPVYLQDISLFLLMYADDTVLLSESRDGLQNILNQLKIYSDNWDISVNVEKTKIVVFRNGGRLSRDDMWFYEGS